MDLLTRIAQTELKLAHIQFGQRLRPFRQRPRYYDQSLDMTREEFSQLRIKFEALLAEPPQQRTALLADLSQSNPVLGDELRRMLTAYESRTD